MTKIDNLFKYLPNPNINWNLIEAELLGYYKDQMENTMQEFKWHQEKDVLTHTKMVCEELIKLEEYQNLNKTDKLILFLAALFHDIGKPACTKIIDGQIRSFHHGETGSLIVRNDLILKFELSGTKEEQNFRETICLLIKYHSQPLYLTNNDEKNKKKLIKLSLNNDLVPDFNLEKLYILSKADVKGRVGIDKEEQLEALEKFKNLAISLNCFKESFKFSDNYTKYAYLNKENVWEYQSLYDDTWGEIILLVGLPGVGKDTFIKNNYPNMETISLDDIRETNKIKNTDDQGIVFNIAKDQAKEYLAKKIPFIWNATNVTYDRREKLIRLFHNYNAKVKIIYLETPFNRNLEQNSSRKKEVIESVIYKMLSRLTPPESFEAETIEWICI